MSLVDLGKRLLDSAKHGETEQVRQLMTSGAPFTTDWLGTSPLHMAAQYGHLATAEVLLRAGISRDARTKVDRTPLHIAGQEGHLEIVELLLRHGADIEAKDMLKMTPLHWAVERGHLSVIHSLLQHGANVNVYSKFDKTPVDIAIDSNREDLVQLLQEYVNKPKIKEEIKSSCAGSAKVISANDIKVSGAKTFNTSSISSSQTSGISLSSPVFSLGKGARPILLHASLAHLQKATAAGASAIGNTPKTEIEEDDVSDQSSTSVLATLAALAEATASNTTASTTEALQWLETNGITMFPSDNSTLINSAIEGGQTISLTEAGKLALTWVKEQQNLVKSSTVPPSTISALGSNGVQNLTASGNQKVITIVTDHSQLPSIINSSSPPATSTQIRGNSEANCTESPAKRLRKVTVQTSIKTYGRTPPVNNAAIEREKEKLQRELDEARRQAEKYRTQLQQKEHEAEQYRKQLEEIRTSK